MILLFINLIDILKKFWLLICLLLIFLILIRKPDDDSFNYFKSPFINSSRKLEKFLDNFIWCNIFIYLALGIVFSMKSFY